ncbi:MAG: hypothetical protein ACYCVB_08885 [Bacilli bacterium]
MRVSEIFIRHMNAGDLERGQAKYQYIFDGGERKGRYILWGNPAFVGKILAAVGDAIK